MKMILKIFKNGEQVNEITSETPEEIYKEIANIYICEKVFNQKSKIKKYLNNIIEIEKDFTTNNTKYKYQYHFEGVNL